MNNGLKQQNAHPPLTKPYVQYELRGRENKKYQKNVESKTTTILKECCEIGNSTS